MIEGFWTLLIEQVVCKWTGKPHFEMGGVDYPVVRERLRNMHWQPHGSDEPVLPSSFILWLRHWFYGDFAGKNPEDPHSAWFNHQPSMSQIPIGWLSHRLRLPLICWRWHGLSIPNRFNRGTLRSAGTPRQCRTRPSQRMRSFAAPKRKSSEVATLWLGWDEHSRLKQCMPDVYSTYMTCIIYTYIYICIYTHNIHTITHIYIQCMHNQS